MNFRKIMALLAALAAAPFSLVACGEDNSAGAGDAATGRALYVRVTDGAQRPVADAVVTTEPATRSAVTDGLGTVLLADLPAGMYTVVARHTTLGTARAPVTVTATGVIQVSLMLQRGAADGGPPSDGRPLSDGSPLSDGGPGDGPADVPAGDAAITLQVPVQEGNAVVLTWAPMPDDAFTSYRVYRAREGGGAFEVINVITNPATRTHRDETAGFGVIFRYRIDGLMAGGRVVQSNVQMASFGSFIALNTQVSAMMVDRTRPYLYAVDTVNNSLHFVNTSSKMLEKTIFIGSRPNDLDINMAGNELYVANFGATEIAVVNLDTREKARALAVNTTVGTWDGNPYRLACTTGNTVVFTSMDQWNDLKLVNAMTGAHLHAIGSHYVPDLAASPDGTRLYVGADEVVRYGVDGSRLTQVDTSNRGSYGGRLTVTRDGRHVFYGTRKFLADNLKSVLGTFGEPIFATTSDGTIAIGEKNLHDGTTFAMIRALPVSTRVMALSPDDTTLYLYDTNSSRIYIYRLK